MQINKTMVNKMETRQNRGIFGLLKDDSGNVAMMAGFFIATIAILLSVFMTGGQSKVAYEYQDYEADLHKCGDIASHEFVRWYIGRVAGERLDCECDELKPGSCNMLCTGEIETVEQALTEIGKFCGEMIESSGEHRTFAGVGGTTKTTDTGSFTIAPPAIVEFTHNGLVVNALRLNLGFPQDKQGQQFSNVCNGSEVDSSGDIKDTNCQTVAGEWFVRYAEYKCDPDAPNSACPPPPNCEEGNECPSSLRPLVHFMFDASGQYKEFATENVDFSDTIDNAKNILESVFKVDLSQTAVGHGLYGQQLVCTNGTCGCTVNNKQDGTSIATAKPLNADFSGCIYSANDEIEPDESIVDTRYPDQHRIKDFEYMYGQRKGLACSLGHKTTAVYEINPTGDFCYNKNSEVAKTGQCATWMGSPGDDDYGCKSDSQDSHGYYADHYCDGRGIGEGKDGFCGCSGPIGNNPGDGYGDWYNYDYCYEKQNYVHVNWYEACPYKVVEPIAEDGDFSDAYSCQTKTEDGGSTTANGQACDDGSGSYGVTINNPDVVSCGNGQSACEVMRELEFEPIVSVRFVHKATGEEVICEETNAEGGEVTNLHHEIGSLGSADISNWEWECKKPTDYNAKYVMRDSSCGPKCPTTPTTTKRQKCYVKGCKRDNTDTAKCDAPLGAYDVYAEVKGGAGHKSGVTLGSNVAIGENYDLIPEPGNVSCDKGNCVGGYENSDKTCTGRAYKNTGKLVTGVSYHPMASPVQPAFSNLSVEGFQPGPDANVVADSIVRGQGSSDKGYGTYLLERNLTYGDKEQKIGEFYLHGLKCPQTLNAEPIEEVGVGQGTWDSANEMYNNILDGTYRIFDRGHEALATCQAMSCSLNALIAYCQENDCVGNNIAPIFIMHLEVPEWHTVCEEGSGKVSTFGSKLFSSDSVEITSAPAGAEGRVTRWNAYANSAGGVPGVFEGVNGANDSANRLDTVYCSNEDEFVTGVEGKVAECLKSQVQRAIANGIVIFPHIYGGTAEDRQKLCSIMSGNCVANQDVSNDAALYCGDDCTADEKQQAQANAIANFVYRLVKEFYPETGSLIKTGPNDGGEGKKVIKLSTQF